MTAELATVCNTLEECGFSPFAFVDHYHFNASEEKAMMDTAFKEIERSDLLVAETSEKGIGVGIEIGYAKALRKPVIYLRQTSAEHSTTASGASDFQVIYDDINGLVKHLKEVLNYSINC